MKPMPRLFAYGAAATFVVAAFFILVLGEVRSPRKPVPATIPSTKSVVAIPPMEPTMASADARLPAVDGWIAAGGEGDETAMGDPAVYSDALVQELVRRYDAFPVERRRERGALVYLLSRTNPERNAMEFLTRVIREKPCASLENCASPAEGHDDHDPGLGTPLADPQLMALAMAEQRAEKSALQADWRALAEEAKRSDVQSVKRRAERWLASAPQ